MSAFSMGNTHDEVHGSPMKHLSTTALRQPHNLLRSATGSYLLWVAALSFLAL